MPGHGILLVVPEATSRAVGYSSRRRRRLWGGIGRYSTSTSTVNETKSLTLDLVRSWAEKEDF